jgi:membrane-bound lytic murein transglycosylase D
MEKQLPMTLTPAARLRQAPLSLLSLALVALLSACATPSTHPSNTASATLPATAATTQSPSNPASPLASQQAGNVLLATAAGAASAVSATASASESDEPSVGAPVDALDPDRPVDMADAGAERELWDRVRQGFAMPDLDDDLVRKQEQFYATRPDYVARMTERGGRYLYHVMAEIDKRGMPSELALLPFIESAFNPQAMSSAKASGMWQFIPSTGKDFALKQNIFRDDRRDVLASTRAALDYLQRLHDMFGDWHLALAAYNWGQGNVQRAITRNQKAGLPTDHASLRMPDETRAYVPKLQAVKNIVLHPDTFGLSLPPLKNHPYFLSVPIERDMDVDLAAKLAGVPTEEFKSLNPQMNKPVILAAGTEQVLLPYDNAARFLSSLREHKGPLASWTAWVVPKTMRPADAAKQVGMTEAELRAVNRIPPRMLVKGGSTLLVPRGANRQADVSEHLADNALMTLAPDLPPLRKLTLRAGKHGESVASVARRYRTSASQVAQWNRVSASSSFKPGSSIVVYVAAKSTRTASKSSTRPSRRGKTTASAHTSPSRTRTLR